MRFAFVALDGTLSGVDWLAADRLFYSAGAANMIALLEFPPGA